MKKSGLKIGMIGAGNLARHLAPALEKAGHQITVVYSRTAGHATDLAKRLLQPQITTQPDFTAFPADLYLLAVPDSVLPQLLEQAVFPENSLVAHTSGTQPLAVFEAFPAIRGAVFYPLQTFSKEAVVTFRHIPVCLETNHENAMLLLEKTAASLTEKVVKMASEERKLLHLAAVFACNFTNHLFGISSAILKQQQLPFDLLQPLVEETVQKAFRQEPFSVQTGPAVRRDETTLQAHLQLLNEQPAFREIYELLSRSIQQRS